MEIIRTPVCVPLPCYGSWQRGAACDACAFRKGCRELRRGRRTLEDLQFKLVSTRWDNAPSAPPPATDVVLDYVTAYRLVTGRKTNSKLSQEQQRKIRAAAKESNVSVIQYCILIMHLWWRANAGNPQAVFYPNMLCGPYAQKTVAEAKERAIQKYGGFFMYDVGRLAGRKTVSVQDLLRNSELVFARAYVNSRIRGGMPLKDLLSTIEFQLDPLWLALEDEYVEHHAQRTKQMESLVATEHRYNVTLACKFYRSDKSILTGMLEMRGSIMLDVLREVLDDYGLTPSKLEYDGTPISNGAKFWARIASAIIHYRAYCALSDISCIPAP